MEQTKKELGAHILLTCINISATVILPEKKSYLPMAFANIGHAYIHIFTAFYFVIVLSIETDWTLSYAELIELWTLGALLVGLAALPAGWLADRWSATGMLAIFFIGMGASSILAGFADSPPRLSAMLAGLGLFAAIYHPVGIPWLVRNATVAKGKALGINGIFGGLGNALAGIVAGVMIDLAGWRGAFIVPGIVCVATGLAFIYFRARGRITDARADTAAPHQESKQDAFRVFGVLLCTMFLAAMIYQSTQISLPKLFTLRMDGLIDGSATRIGLLIGVVYTVSGLMQVVGGHLADRYPLRTVYIGTLLVQGPLLFIAASVGGPVLLLVATLMVMSNSGALPAENMLLAKYTPTRHHGLAFGIKFVLAFGAGPLAVLFVAAMTERAGGFANVFTTLAIFGAVATLLALMLPRARQHEPSLKAADA